MSRPAGHDTGQKEETPLPRLDEIGTSWSLLRRAHQGPMIGAARNALVLRYYQAIARYLNDLMKDEEDASEVAQDVLVRLLNGNFTGATAEKGRFRDYLKKAVRNTALTFLRLKQKRAARLKDLAS